MDEKGDEITLRSNMLHIYVDQTPFVRYDLTSPGSFSFWPRVHLFYWGFILLAIIRL